jgi:ribosomal protein S18 acetylase RimI-like enzyme
VKVDEPFDPDAEGLQLPESIICRPATLYDRDSIALLMAQRNPATSVVETLKQTEKELTISQTDSSYRLLVAEVDGQVAGFCRFYDSKGLPTQKKIYPAPEGWYAMGTLVDPGMRRRGIARFLFDKRLIALREIGVFEVYSMVDGTNQTSLRMHREFGYEQIASAPGFLHIRFECGEGHLFSYRL